ncbi:MAG: DUF4071 domain-containing protein, partial [Chloroflexi bacterium]|nr:DUF4071 domain-containing protein [Chloroflexota bacterium]
INLAFLLNVRAKDSTGDEAVTDKVLAKRIRQQVVDICLKIRQDKFDDRGDKYWVVATLEEAFFGLGDEENYNKLKQYALSLVEADWERKSTDEQIAKLKDLI